MIRPMLWTCLSAAAWTLSSFAADWPMLRGSADRSGFVDAEIKAPFRLKWERHFENERLGTAMEPVIDGGRVFVATHNGSLYALDAESGEPLWHFKSNGAFLHSPTAWRTTVLAASSDGSVYARDVDNGNPQWSFSVGRGGCSASPLVVDGVAFIGTRSGEFIAMKMAGGRLWRAELGVPIRQSAAVSDGKVFVTAEDLRVRCFNAADGKLLWTSEPLAGQTARDYYPVVVKTGGRTFVVVRTNPLLNMGQRIGRDRTMLCRNAGVDDSGWQKVDAWVKSDAARGTPELWAKEQSAVVEYLDQNRDARSFFVLDAATGKEAFIAPVLWVAGCQAVGAQPALTSDGRLLVFYRSAYGNWNHGVAPLVALGLLDLGGNAIQPLFHKQGRQPPWNTFWGTADESQNFVVVGNTVLIVHQGTLSGFDLKSSNLFHIFGERDTYGGFRNPPWARNEWHGPGRGGVAVVGSRIYWQTGSRLLCIAAGESGPAAKEKVIKGDDVLTQTADPDRKRSADSRRVFQQLVTVHLAKAVSEIISQRWAPLFVNPGLAGRDFSFDDSTEVFEALAWAYPHLRSDFQPRVREFLAEEWKAHPPFSSEAAYSLKDGAAREFVAIPAEYRARLGGDKQPHPFGGVYSAWLYAERCDELKRVNASWPLIKTAFDDFIKTGWNLDAVKGDLHANRYLASLLAFTKLAELAKDEDAVRSARAKADETASALAEWWKRAAERGSLKQFKGAGELDPFIGGGDGLSFKVAPHRHKIALFQDLTPEVAALIRERAPEAFDRVWELFDLLYQTWHLQGEERQVHFGENFVDPPDLALGAFKAMAFLQQSPGDELLKRMDLPFCKADLYHATKLALTIETLKSADPGIFE